MMDGPLIRKEALLRTIMAAGMFIALMLPAGCAFPYKAPILGEKGITFKVRVPGAKKVSIVGSFNRWDRDKDPMTGPDRDGWWSITLPLPPGRHEYLFLIDGETWHLDPHGVGMADDGFGGKNSVLYL